MELTPEAEMLLRQTWRSPLCPPRIQESINELLKFSNVPLEGHSPLNEERLSEHVDEVKKVLFLDYLTSYKDVIRVIEAKHDALYKAKVTLNDWRLWYDSISKDDKDKGPIYGATLQALDQIEKLPGLSGGVFEKVELAPEDKKLNEQVGEEILKDEQ